MIELDGSHGEGGGAILRTALAMSTITQKPFRIKNIRASRPEPGLKAQHLETIRAFTSITNGKAVGATLESMNLTFTPGNVNTGTYEVKIGTAGSITLVMQALLPAVLYSEEKIGLNITGGTDVAWSPSWDYFANVLLSQLNGFGTIDAKLERRGYYPKGDGHATITITPKHNTLPMTLSERGELKGIHAIMHASTTLKPRNVTERMTIEFKKKYPDASILTEYCETTSTGTGITAWAEYANTRIGIDALGDPKTTSEILGAKAAVMLEKEMKNDAPCDTHMADMIPIYLAIYGGTIRLPSITKHVESNLHVIEEFMPGRIKKQGLVLST
jgi:RNA 3'-terminal phosphate cyclase (GTP)